MERPGRRLFEFVDCLGQGGFGEVYRARIRSPGGLASLAAVKVLRRDLSVDGDAVRRLRDEGRLLARLDHPTILRAFDLVRLDGRLALVTELVEGADLAELLRADPPLPARALVEVIGRVAAALDAAHATPGPDGRPLALVHRDVKPTNVRVGRFGEVKLLDFGIAHFEGPDREARTATNLLVGSLPFMAPERFLSREARTEGDVYALGCTLYQGLTGHRYVERGDVRRLAALAADPAAHAAHLEARMALLGRGEGERARLLELLRALLDHDPARRPTAAELARACEDLVERLGGPRLRAWCRERAWPDPPARTGELTGRVLEEQPVDLAPPDEEATRAERLPAPDATVRATRGAPVPRRRGVGCGVLGLAIWLVVSGFTAIIAALARIAAS